jgi:hypothetical protein
VPNNGGWAASYFSMLIAMFEVAGYFRHNQLRFVITEVPDPGNEFLSFLALQYHDSLAVPIYEYLIVLAHAIGEGLVVQDMALIDFRHAGTRCQQRLMTKARLRGKTFSPITSSLVQLEFSDIALNPLLDSINQLGIHILIFIRDVQVFNLGQLQITKLIDDP